MTLSVPVYLGYSIATKPKGASATLSSGYQQEERAAVQDYHVARV